MSDPDALPLEIPSSAPVMPLPGVVLLPHALLPLYIFEPRYRRMLASVLEGDRMFCVTQYRPGVDEARSDHDLHDLGGIGVVRACVGRPDGTSHLILQGIARVRLLGFEQRQPFRIARLEPVRPQPLSGPTEAILRVELLARLGLLVERGVRLPPGLAEAMHADLPLEVLSDVAAAALIGEPEVRQLMLETAGVAARTRLLLARIPG